MAIARLIFSIVSPPRPASGAAMPPKTNIRVPISADAVPDCAASTALIASAPATVLMPLISDTVKNRPTSASTGSCSQANSSMIAAQLTASVRPPRSKLSALKRRARREKIIAAIISPIPFRPNSRLNCMALMPYSLCITKEEEPM